MNDLTKRIEAAQKELDQLTQQHDSETTFLESPTIEYRGFEIIPAINIYTDFEPSGHTEIRERCFKILKNGEVAALPKHARDLVDAGFINIESAAAESVDAAKSVIDRCLTYNAIQFTKDRLKKIKKQEAEHSYLSKKQGKISSRLLQYQQDLKKGYEGNN